MLTRLALENIAIIESLELELQPGLNVITGETGSGKSLILDAIQCVFHKRISPKDLLRHGANRGRVELSFDLESIHNRQQVQALLEEAGIEILPEETELILSREITPSSSRCRLNGIQVAIDFMERLSTLMLEIYGQHDLHNLFSSSRQRDLLDSIGGEPVLTLRQEVRRAFREIQRLKADLEALQIKQQDRERQLDFLTFQIEEITQAELSDLQEDEKLQLERERLSQAENLLNRTLHAIQLIDGEEDFESPSVLKRLSQIQKSLSGGGTVDPQFTQWYEKISGIQEELRGFIQELYVYNESIHTGPERMQEIIDRLDTLERLKRKYGGSIESVLKTATDIETELDTLHRAESCLAEIEQMLQQQEAHYIGLCDHLTTLRKQIIATLESTVQRELEALMLPAARFAIQVEPVSPSEHGQDQITFLFSANPGEPLKPLAQVGSGGELARLMLALKIQTAHTDALTTLILDEIDTGMSGKTVRAVAEKLQALQHQCQIIVVTHQPIVAAKAQWHFHIQKHLHAHGVEVTATCLTDPDSRKTILSQLASGLETDDTATTQFIEQLLA